MFKPREINMSVFSVRRRNVTAALIAGGLGLAGALVASTPALAQTKSKGGAEAARNKTKIEVLAGKPAAQTSRTRQGEYPTRPGRPPPFR